MIPKIIHYVWLGDEMPKMEKQCIQTWKKHLPNYEFKHWHEGNLPSHPYLNKALSKKRYAYAADYIRCWALNEYGGIYLDTDMYVIKTFDSLLDNQFFIGQEDEKLINCALFGAIKQHDLIKVMLKEYDLKGKNKDYTEESIPRLFTRLYNSNKPDIKIYPPDYFYPFPFNESLQTINNFKDYIKPETIAIHLWNASAMPEIGKNRKKHQSIQWKIYWFALNIYKFLRGKKKN